MKLNLYFCKLSAEFQIFKNDNFYGSKINHLQIVLTSFQMPPTHIFIIEILYFCFRTEDILLQSEVWLFIFSEGILILLIKNSIAFYLQALPCSCLLTIMATTPPHLPWLFFSTANTIKQLI